MAEDTTEAAGTTIARRMREVRQRRGWSQDDLAARIREIGGRISRPVLYRIEEGGTRAHRLSVEDFLVIAAALGVAPHYLMTDTTDEAAARLLITPHISMDPRSARAWMAGVGSPPGGESLRFYLSERPESELAELHEQWLAAGKRLPGGATLVLGFESPAAVEQRGAGDTPDPREIEDDVVERVPRQPPDDRRKSTRRRTRKDTKK